MSRKRRSLRCACGKQGFIDADDAQDTLDAWHERMVKAHAPRVPQRTYECLTVPGTWHITSQPYQAPGVHFEPRREPNPSFRESPRSKQRRNAR